MRLGDACHNHLGKELSSLGRAHSFCSFARNLAIFNIAMGVLEGVMDTALWDLSEAINERLELIYLGVWDGEEWMRRIPVKWVRNFNLLIGRCPVPIDTVWNIIRPCEA
jgi:hypothetical protein